MFKATVILISLLILSARGEEVIKRMEGVQIMIGKKTDKDLNWENFNGKISNIFDQKEGTISLDIWLTRRLPSIFGSQKSYRITVYCKASDAVIQEGFKVYSLGSNIKETPYVDIFNSSSFQFGFTPKNELKILVVKELKLKISSEKLNKGEITSNVTLINLEVGLKNQAKNDDSVFRMNYLEKKIEIEPAAEDFFSGYSSILDLFAFYFGLYFYFLLSFLF